MSGLSLRRPPALEEKKQMTPETNTNWSQTATTDAGLRQHFLSIYTTMAGGLSITGLVSWFVANTPSVYQAIFGGPQAYIVMFAPLLFVFLGFNQRTIMTKSSAFLAGMFYLFSAVLGLSFATIFMAYTGVSIAKVFFITAGTFAAMSLYGYTTKADLSRLGSFLMMGVIGLLLAIVVNIFLKSTMMAFIISAIGVLVYTLLIAFDTQNIKAMYSASYGEEANKKSAIMGALSLYINVINLFQFLMMFMGDRR